MPVSGRIRERRCNNPDATLDRGCGVMTSPRPAHETIPNWPPSNWNGGRDQIGIGGRLRWNPHYRAAGGKSDPGDAFMLADILRTDGDRFRPLLPMADDIKALRALV